MPTSSAKARRSPRSTSHRNSNQSSVVRVKGCLRNTKPGTDRVLAHARAYDLWNARYFILPINPNGWTDEEHGYASLYARNRADCARRSLLPRVRKPAESPSSRSQPTTGSSAATKPPTRGCGSSTGPASSRAVADRRTDRGGIRPARRSCSENDPLWFDPDRHRVRPPRLAWVEPGKVALAPYLSTVAPDPAESVKITRLRASACRDQRASTAPVSSVLADVFYPADPDLDGQPSPVSASIS